MSTDYEHIVVNNNEDEQRYESVVEGHLAVLTYSREGSNTIIFFHAGVPPAIEGNGVASTITHFALEEARAQHLTVVPLCPFVAEYIREHEEFQSLVEPAKQKRLL